jgi:hypothetical protein
MGWKKTTQAEGGSSASYPQRTLKIPGQQPSLPPLPSDYKTFNFFSVSTSIKISTDSQKSATPPPPSKLETQLHPNLT